jgi:hypothetical protein
MTHAVLYRHAEFGKRNRFSGGNKNRIVPKAAASTLASCDAPRNTTAK